MASKDLNGAYYGPSVLPPPPPPPRYHHHHSSSSCCCCNPFTCLCKCIFNLIFKLICTALVLLGIAVFILWLIFRPNLLKFHIKNASLTQFDLTPNSTLHYDIVFNASVRNPNSRLGIYYDEFQVDAFYELERFGTVNLTPFYQDDKNTTDFVMRFNGQQVIVLDEDVDFAKDKSDGVIELGLRMRLRMRFKLIKLLNIRVGKFGGKVYCDVKVPVNGSVTAFEPKKCDIGYV